ncbi:hypothetical protein MRX96_009264 [Rhipicephalus microplus]
MPTKPTATTNNASTAGQGAAGLLGRFRACCVATLNLFSRWCGGARRRGTSTKGVAPDCDLATSSLLLNCGPDS